MLFLVIGLILLWIIDLKGQVMESYQKALNVKGQKVIHQAVLHQAKQGNVISSLLVQYSLLLNLKSNMNGMRVPHWRYQHRSKEEENTSSDFGTNCKRHAIGAKLFWNNSKKLWSKW